MDADVVIVGAGAFGLWLARACRARGLSVAVAEDAGAPPASATPVGALAAFRPAPWSPAKAFQAAALADLPAAVAALEAETGAEVGFARIGRRVPLHDAGARARAEADAAADAGLRLLDPGAAAGPAGWPAPGAFGTLADEVTGRIDGPLLLAALRLAAGPVAAAGPLRALLPGRPAAARFDGGALRAPAVVVATGAAAFPALAPWLGPGAGTAAQGQAARLVLPDGPPPGAAVVQGRGLWVVPHADGTAGVGATSARGRWDREVDGALDAVLARAAAAVPALAGAEVAARWAGLRPAAAGGTPLAGPVPGAPGLWALTGGGGVGLALAPRLAAALAGEIAAALGGGATQGPPLPEGFRPRAG